MTRKEGIVRLLKEHGPMTVRELAEELGATVRHISGSLASLRNRWPGTVRIAGYRRDEDGGLLYPRALWALGGQPDARRPGRLSKQEYNRRERDARRARVPSIFHVGLAHKPNRVKLAASVQLGRQL